MSHFSASSHLEGKLFLGRPELKVKTGLPGVEGESSSLLCCETEWPLLSALPFGIGKGNDLTNSEVSFRLSLQSGSGKSSAKGLSLLFPYMLMLLSVSSAT